MKLVLYMDKEMLVKEYLKSIIIFVNKLIMKNHMPKIKMCFIKDMYK